MKTNNVLRQWKNVGVYIEIVTSICVRLFQVFSLPQLKAHNKFKLTAHEGSRIRKVGFINFRSKSGKNYDFIIYLKMFHYLKKKWVISEFS